MGEEYELISGSLEDIPRFNEAVVEKLLSICRGLSRWQPSTITGESSEPYRGLPRPGDIFNQQADIRQLLGRHGWSLHHSDSDSVEYWTRPGKSISEGWSASLGYHQGDNGQPHLYVFSSGAAPLEPNRSYDAFALFALLDHAGDFSAAAAVAGQLYGAELSSAQAAYRQEVGVDFEPFPIDLLPPVVRNYVVEHAEALGIDSAFVAVPMLAQLAGLIGQSRQIELKRTWKEPAIIWTCIVSAGQ